MKNTVITTMIRISEKRVGQIQHDEDDESSLRIFTKNLSEDWVIKNSSV